MAGDNGMGGSSGAVSEPPGASAAAGSRTVFLSYASPDAAVANQVCQYLESHGVSCWMAPRDVKPGAAYADAIVRAINEASALVLVLSRAAMASEHVSREVERAASKHKPVVAFRVDAANLSAELEYFLSRSQWIDVPALGMPAALVKLAEAVGQGSAAGQTNPGVGGGGEASGRSTTARAVGTASVEKRLVVTAAVVIVLGIGGVLAARFWQSKHGESQAPAVAAIPDKSIAVLPFADMSEKKDQEYFADGMAEEILGLLAKIPSIKVIGRTSSFQFKGKNEDLRTIGKKLGAEYVLEGSVRKVGNRVRITAQLIAAQSGTHRWSETYERDVGDVLKMQDEIAAALVQALKISIDADTLRSRPTLTNLEAYNLYLRGVYANDRFDKDGVNEALNYFRRALELAPTFAAAAAALSTVYYQQGEWALVAPSIAFVKARQAAEAALKLDPNLAIAHSILGAVYASYEWDWAAAERENQRALALAPNDEFALWFAARLLMVTGRYDAALAQMEAGLAQNPVGPYFYQALNWIQTRRGKLREAEAASRRALEIDPTYSSARYYLGLVLLARGEREAALASMQQETPEGGQLSGLAIAYYAFGRKANSDEALTRAIKEQSEDSAFSIAEVYAYRGELDEALRWLDRAYAQKDPGLIYIKGDLPLKNLENDPRFKAFLKKMNLPE